MTTYGLCAGARPLISVGVMEKFVTTATENLHSFYPAVPTLMLRDAVVHARQDLGAVPLEWLPDLAERLAWWRLGGTISGSTLVTPEHTVLPVHAASTHRAPR